MSILLSAIFIFQGLILLLVAETPEQHRYLVILIIIPNIWFMVLKTTGLNQVFQRKKTVLKNTYRVLRYWQKCIWVVQRFLLQATKSDHEK